MGGASDEGSQLDAPTASALRHAGPVAEHRAVAVLKSPHFGRHRDQHGGLPYRMDLLEAAGFEPTWTDAHLEGRAANGAPGRLIARTERLATPWAQAWLARDLRRRAEVTMAIFESEGHGVAAARRVRRALRRPAGPPLVIIACWLADLARSGTPRRRRLYRWLYGGVDRVVVFSPNQAATLTSLLGIDPSRIAVVRFGVDLDELDTITTADDGGVVAAGRDRGRDWRTLAAAATGSGWTVDLITRPSQTAGLDLPPEVTLAGVLDRRGYLERLGAASVVVVPTEIREYPTGQTVLLEAMALGKACVVTDTPAMASYVDDGRTAVLVPPHDPVALRTAVDALLADPDRRRAIGDAARADSGLHGGAEAMWAHVAEVLEDALTDSATRTAH